MWLVLLKFAKDRFLGVDTPEQPVPPCVRYRIACLLIGDTLGSVSCLVVREGYQDYLTVMALWATWETLAMRGYCDYLSKARHTTRSKPL
jgi:hypothetical protein